MLKIVVKYENNEIIFKFKSQYLADAMKFVQDCLETCERGTIVYITEEEE